MGFISYLVFIIFAIGIVGYVNRRGEWFIMEIILGLIFGLFIGVIVGFKLCDYYKDELLWMNMSMVGTVKDAI